MPRAVPPTWIMFPSPNGPGRNHEKFHESSHESSTMTAVWRTLTSNLGWKLLSVVLAVFLWVAVEGEPELVTVQSVPVFYRNVEPTLALVANPPVTIRLEMRGATGVL